MTSIGKAKKFDSNLSLDQHQLIYSIILEMGLPSTPDAWARVISRLSLKHGGKQIIAQGASMRYSTLKKRWDRGKIFGERHDALLEIATNHHKGAKKAVAIEEDDEDERFENGGAPKESSGKGKNKEPVTEVGDEDSSDHEQSDDDDDDEKFAPGPSKRSLEAEDSDEPLPPKRQKKAKKLAKKAARKVVFNLSEQEEDSVALREDSDEV